MPWSPSLPPVTAAELGDVLRAHRWVIIHFWAAWNCTERRFDSVLRPVAEEFPEIVFRSLDVDDPALAAFCLECQVNNVPALGCFANGTRVETVVGVRTAEILRQKFRELSTH